jgi:hypothetical protein
MFGDVADRVAAYVTEGKLSPALSGVSGENVWRVLAAQALFKAHPNDLNAMAAALVGRRVGIELDDDGKVVRYLPVEEAEAHNDLRARLARVEAVARQCVIIQPTTPQNAEVLTMSYSVFVRALRDNGMPDWPDDVEIPMSVRRLLVGLQQLVESFQKQEQWGPWAELTRGDLKPPILEFLGKWPESAFARLEVSHKLAAAFCVTDIIDSDELHAPWGAWSLIVPDGLFGPLGPARVWLLGKTPIALLFPPKSGAPTANVTSWSALLSASDRRPVFVEMITALVLGACAALSDPGRRKRSGRWGNTPSVKSKRRGCGPPPEGARYILAQPVSIDLRATVLDSLSGEHRSGGSPKVQFLVRGHWRNQAHGPGHTLRVLKWIEPFWKGPEDTRVLLRAHKVKKTKK